SHRGPAQPPPHRADHSAPRSGPPDHPGEGHALAARETARPAHDLALPTPARVKLGTGALVWAGFDGPQAPDPMLDAIQRGAIGGILLFAFRGNIRSKAQVRAMLREIQDAARRGGLPPVPVAVDQEGGTVIRIGYRATFPSAMAIGATGDPAYAERSARAFGEGPAAGGSGAMSAHVRSPALDPKDGATVSRAILTDLLRGELGFTGFAVTDALDMKGITDALGPDQIVTRAIAAGADAAMVTTGLDLQ